MMNLPWTRPSPPSELRVTWNDSGGAAWWPVNVLDPSALPPPAELKDLSLEELIDILTSAKPLHEALKKWLTRKSKKSPAEEIPMDPHRRVDTSSFLLQRTRRLSWALTALRSRLERPVFSETGLIWRLRGPIG